MTQFFWLKSLNLQSLRIFSAKVSFPLMTCSNQLLAGVVPLLLPPVTTWRVTRTFSHVGVEVCVKHVCVCVCKWEHWASSCTHTDTHKLCRHFYKHTHTNRHTVYGYLYVKYAPIFYSSVRILCHTHTNIHSHTHTHTHYLSLFRILYILKVKFLKRNKGWSDNILFCPSICVCPRRVRHTHDNSNGQFVRHV